MAPNSACRHLVALSFLTMTVAGCDLVERYMAGTPEDQVAEAVVEQWAAPGAPFLEGVSGRDTVASVSPTGARAWEVAVIPPSGGAPVVWSLEVVRVEVYPTVTGPAFGRYLGDRARELGMRTFLPPEVLSAMAGGDIRGVSDLEVRYGLADRSGRNTEHRVAYLVPGAGGASPTWRIQPVSRSANVLLETLELVTGDMVYRDDRVLSCMGSGSPAGIARTVQLACVGKVWAEEFGGES